MAQSPFVDERAASNFNMSDFFINQSVGFASFMSDAAKEHDDIIQAIAAKSPSSARTLAEAHIADIAHWVSKGLRCKSRLTYLHVIRLEESRVVKWCVRTVNSRLLPDDSNKKV